MTFGEKLKQLRESRHISQQKLADDLDVSQSSIGAYEKNIREPGFETIQRIADYFHVPFISLMPSANIVDDNNIMIVAESMNNNPVLFEIFNTIINFDNQQLSVILSVIKSMK